MVAKTDPKFSGKTVLIVDDSAIIREALSRLYAALGFEVVAALGDAFSALNFLQNEKPDLVSLDIIMPEMHGIECYRRMKRDFKEVDIVLLSCLSQELSIVERFQDEIPALVFQRKPNSLEELRESLNAFYQLDVQPSRVTSDAMIPPPPPPPLLTAKTAQGPQDDDDKPQVS